MTEISVIIRYFEKYNVEAVRNFYSQTTYRNAGSVSNEDEIVAAFDKDKIIGVFRVCEESGVNVLRGFNIIPKWQKRGIGKQMLQCFERELRDRSCYLICKRGLNRFYEYGGFIIATKEIPDFLKERKNKYGNSELNILFRN